MANKVPGKNIKLFRELRGMTRQQVADEIGVSKTTYGRYETGMLNVSDEKMNSIAQYFGIDLEFFTNPNGYDHYITIQEGLGEEYDDKKILEELEMFNQQEESIAEDQAERRQKYQEKKAFYDRYVLRSEDDENKIYELLEIIDDLETQNKLALDKTKTENIELMKMIMLKDSKIQSLYEMIIEEDSEIAKLKVD